MNGDNLPVWKALGQHFAGKVKLDKVMNALEKLDDRNQMVGVIQSCQGVKGTVAEVFGGCGGWGRWEWERN